MPAKKPVNAKSRKTLTSREGKKAFLTYVAPEQLKAIKLMAVAEDTSMQALVGKAFDLLLETSGRRRLAARVGR
jgi:hypothetical protein